jgi:glycosyltransferase involved in cell wall biosynthesis
LPEGRVASLLKVSVIIPAYNQAQFLGEAIQSVLDQTYPNFELLVVNDASPDNTAEIVGQFSDPRIRYIAHEENRGLPAARNSGMRAAEGELIALLDGDDFFHADKLAAHVDFYKHHAGIGATYNNRFELNYSALTIRELVRPPQIVGLKDFVLGFPFTPSDMVIRSKWAHKVGYFNELCVNGAEDLDFPIRLSLTGCKFQRVNRALNYRRHHSGRRRVNLQGRKDDWVAVLERTFNDNRCPDDVKALRKRAFAEHTLVLVNLAFAQEETTIGQIFLQELLQLSPDIFVGNPCKYIRDLVPFSIADENLEHAELLKKIIKQIPSELPDLSDQYPWAVSYGYLLRGIRALMWGRGDDGADHFYNAVRWNAGIDKPLLRKLAHQISDIEAEFGRERAEEIFKHLSPYLEKIGGKPNLRWLESTLSINRAHGNYKQGKFSEVPADVRRAFTSDPRNLSNRGIWSILMRSLIKQMTVRVN